MSNIFPHIYKVTQTERIHLKGHKPIIIWFTGLSSSGKSTIADHVARMLHEQGIHTYNLDGDILRAGLNKDLGFSDSDRSENLRRVAEVSQILIDSGLVVLAAFISPFTKDRVIIKNIVGENNYIEVFVDTPLEECEKRDVKGLYTKARKGEIRQFTGIDSPYEIPKSPNITIQTLHKSPEEAAQQIVDFVIPLITK